MKLITTGTVATNRKARFNYHIMETFQAGIVLTGGEVKSLRQGHANIQESYARIDKGELFLINAHITVYAKAKGGFVEQTSSQPRKLLVKAKELKVMKDALQAKGLTLVPLELYFNERGLAKIRLGIAKGKNAIDKRADIKKRDTQRETRRLMVEKNRK